MRNAFLALAVVAVVATTVSADPKKDLEKLAGKWQPTLLQVGDAKLPAEQLKKISLVIEGEKYTVTAEAPDKGTLKIDKKDKLLTMDIVGTEGPNKGKTILAIYEIDGDTLKICYALEGKVRPTEFKAANAKMMLATYKKVK